MEFIIDGSGDIYRFPWWSHMSITEAGDDDLSEGSYPPKDDAPDTYWNIYRSVYCNQNVQIKLRQGNDHNLINQLLYVNDLAVGETKVYMHTDDDSTNHVDYKLWVARKA